MFRRRLAQLLLRGHQGFTRSKGEPANFAAATQQTRQQYNVPSEYQHFRSRGGYRQGPQGSRRGVFWLTTLGGGTAVVVLTHREEIPYTHRKHTVLVSERFVQQLGLAEFERVKAAAELDGSLLPKWHPYTKQITRVGKRIADKASDGHADSGKKNHMQGVDWEFYVIDSPQVNAFVVPGGKVVCFTGLIKLMRNDDDLIAAVLGHEVAHILARHIAEKLTRGSFIFLAQFFLYTALGIPVPIELLQLTLFLPNSRKLAKKGFTGKLEKEADIIGIHLAARACYDPAAAIVAQERMAAVVEGTLGKDSPALRWLSTHPLSKERIDALVQNLPKAQATYEESGCEQQKQDFWGSLPHAVPRIKRAAEWGWE